MTATPLPFIFWIMALILAMNAGLLQMHVGPVAGSGDISVMVRDANGAAIQGLS